MRLRTAGDAELELWAAHRHVAPLEAVLGKPLRFEVVTGEATLPPIKGSKGERGRQAHGKPGRARKHRTATGPQAP